MRPRPLYAALLCLALLVLSCSDTEQPSELMTSPDEVSFDVANFCPTTEDHVLTVQEDGSDFVTILMYDPDDEDHLEIVVTQKSSHATVLDGVSYLDYKPGPNFCGTDVIKFKVFDGECYSDEHKIDITVTCLNDCPTANGQAVDVDKNGSVLFNVTGSDIDGDPIQFALVAGAAHGSILFGSDGEVRYTPSAGYCGPDGFTFTVSDGQCTSAPGSVSINVDCGDTDGDGVPDTDDDCADSIIGATVVIDGCETGVLNSVDANGCTLADIVDQHVDAAAETAANHGKFVSAMTKKLKEMVTGGVITEDQKDSIMGCIGSSGFGKIDPTH